MEAIEKARDLLKKSDCCDMDREQIVAFAYLSAFCEHFPEDHNFEDIALLDKWKVIRKLEYDRFIKQRRIALSKLCAVLCP